MTYQGKKEPYYECKDTKFDEGGEGMIFDVIGRPDLVVKVYKPGKLAQSTVEKLSAMINAVPPGAESCIAWPLDILLQNGRVCGFVMNKFSGMTPLVHLLSNPDFTWDKRIVVAYNLCDIVEMIHAADQCIGDMNPKNFGVNPNTGKIVAFDADSFHFQQGDKLYPCYVGDEHYYPRELQMLLRRKNDMRTLDPRETFSQYTDLFALAVLIFQLLFQGHNPFVERTMKEYEYGSSKYIQEPVDNILNQMSPYFNPRPGTDIPVMSVPVTILPESMQEMFRDSLVGENRARPGEWKRELLQLGRQLTTCPSKGHKYWMGLHDCPWCRMEQRRPEVEQIMRDTQTSTPNTGSVGSPVQPYSAAMGSVPPNTATYAGYVYQNAPTSPISPAPAPNNPTPAQTPGTSVGSTNPKTGLRTGWRMIIVGLLLSSFLVSQKYIDVFDPFVSCGIRILFFMTTSKCCKMGKIKKANIIAGIGVVFEIIRIVWFSYLTLNDWHRVFRLSTEYPGRIRIDRIALYAPTQTMFLVMAVVVFLLCRAKDNAALKAPKPTLFKGIICIVLTLLIRILFVGFLASQDTSIVANNGIIVGLSSSIILNMRYQEVIRFIGRALQFLGEGIIVNELIGQ